MLPAIIYRGRFAPSPTGPLHFGSLVAAVASYLDAKHHHGAWLVRMEDLDVPRCVPGAAVDILHTLEAFGLHWDEGIMYQSQRAAAYAAALQQLQDIGAVYPCCCTRKEIADSALHGIDGQIYPGTCRNGIPAGREGRAWRVRTNLTPSPLRGEGWGEGGSVEIPLSPSRSDGTPSHSTKPSKNDGLVAGYPAMGEGSVGGDDALQGHIAQYLESEIGDFVVKRADGLFAYQLAVVVDDAFQNITHVVRGADLLASTPRQIYLQRLLGLSTPGYMHLPVAVNEAGEKLSKQTLAAPVDRGDPAATLWRVLLFLRQQAPEELRGEAVENILQWAAVNWRPENLRGIKSLPVFDVQAKM